MAKSAIDAATNEGGSMQHSAKTLDARERHRVDDFGRAYAGSQRQLQTYVNLRPVEFSSKVLEVLSPPPTSNSKLRWVSPLAAERFLEYRDEDFLRVLRLDKYARDLRQFWPGRGPSWDALGILDSASRDGVVLVEAKSHISELESQCQAESQDSVEKISIALAETKRWLGVPESTDWTSRYYQFANRLAFLYFLRSRQIQAWLVNVYFLNDPHFKNPPAPQKVSEWEGAIEKVNDALGLTRKNVSYLGKLFLDAAGGY
jgi:hypothetical protein